MYIWRCCWWSCCWVCRSRAAQQGRRGGCTQQSRTGGWLHSHSRAGHSAQGAVKWGSVSPDGCQLGSVWAQSASARWHVVPASRFMTKLNKHARMNARRRVQRGESLASVAECLNVSPRTEETGKGSSGRSFAVVLLQLPWRVCTVLRLGEHGDTVFRVSQWCIGSLYAMPVGVQGVSVVFRGV